MLKTFRLAAPRCCFAECRSGDHGYAESNSRSILACRRSCASRLCPRSGHHSWCAVARVLVLGLGVQADRVPPAVGHHSRGPSTKLVRSLSHCPGGSGGGSSVTVTVQLAAAGPMYRSLPTSITVQPPSSPVTPSRTESPCAPVAWLRPGDSPLVRLVARLELSAPARPDASPQGGRPQSPNSISSIRR